MKILSLLILLAATLPGLGANGENDYVAHEWGTFTSVQGADGVAIEWNPLETTELPPFVHDWSRAGLNRLPAGALGTGVKSRFRALQRMETPVIYFYSDRERTVDVTVRFPQGLITEWYPAASDIGPSVFPPNRLGVALDGLVQQTGIRSGPSFATLLTARGTPDSRIVWNQVRVLPAGPTKEASGRLPMATSGSHYFAARETDAAILQMKPATASGGSSEYEKFLFYRGISNFKTPLLATLNGDDESQVVLRNTGSQALHHLFVLVVRNGGGTFASLDQVSPGEQALVELPGGSRRQPLQELVPQLAGRMEEALVSAGLYQREAQAMVRTWRESWLEEDGLRVLYLLPRSWTDEVLPLTLQPKPAQLERVMVGRAEIITPEREWELLRQIVRFSEGNPGERQRTIAEVKQLGLGRFVEPAIRRVLGARPSQNFSQSAWELMRASVRAGKAGNSIARQ